MEHTMFAFEQYTICVLIACIVRFTSWCWFVVVQLGRESSLDDRSPYLVGKPLCKRPQKKFKGGGGQGASLIAWLFKGGSLPPVSKGMLWTTAPPTNTNHTVFQR